MAKSKKNQDVIDVQAEQAMTVVTIAYTDERVIKVNVPKTNVQRFIATIQKGDLYYDTKAETGFWSPLSGIRYTQISPAEQKPETVEEQIDAIPEKAKSE